MQMSYIVEEPGGFKEEEKTSLGADNFMWRKSKWDIAEEESDHMGQAEDFGLS